MPDQELYVFSAGYSGSTSDITSDVSSAYSRSLQSFSLSSESGGKRDPDSEEFIRDQNKHLDIFNQRTSSPTHSPDPEKSDGSFRHSSVITYRPHFVELQRPSPEYRQPQGGCLYSDDSLWRLAACLPSPSITLSPGSSYYQDCSGHQRIPLMLATERSTMTHYCGIYEDELDRIWKCLRMISRTRS